ncbi:hypothetical protein [Burkholderia ubonensis]|uniref:hypothetical protein n=1 Tax=Burkholderia ubonensis TaxID=101571 RepID=UPI0012F871BB|nr:hypothetical protein [Burkholderia ubonensis]
MRERAGISAGNAGATADMPLDAASSSIRPISSGSRGKWFGSTADSSALPAPIHA